VCAKSPQIDYRWSDRRDLNLASAEPLHRSDHAMQDLMKLTAEISLKAARVFYQEEAPQPTHIIHTSCTGYYAPNAIQALVAEKSWNSKVTNAYHMGCYAAFPAVRMAAGFVASGDAKVDIVHNELCSMHFNPSIYDPEQFVVQSLFADGHIKYTVSSSAPKISLKLHGIEERLIPGSLDAMTWLPGDFGFHMTLSRQVPAFIVAEIKRFLPWFLDRLQVATPIEEMIFAVHPGGPKIIDAVQQALGLEETQIALSREVLRERGNMSSATLPHIWQKILATHTNESGRGVLSLAFGPGLTIFASYATLDGPAHPSQLQGPSSHD
jgi:predicted naringenin-chalcone synthase